ncbi:TPA: nitroreductase family protein, partial [Acinetobacter baumannii]|nr:nitroreductase family protein [Acinetobacter baumannii]HEM8247593.1 nitroreductase family protein [Acinetobacter baumannii]
MDLLNTVKSRYTTKAYDPEKKIPQEKFNKLLEILRFTPSSVNIQPWHFLVADNPTAKERIAKALTGRYAYNAPKVLESSHTLVFCTRTDISPEYL